MGRAAYECGLIMERVDSALAHHDLFPLEREPTVGELIHLILLLSLDPLLLLGNLDGFDGTLDDLASVGSDDPSDGDHLR